MISTARSLVVLLCIFGCACSKPSSPNAAAVDAGPTTAGRADDHGGLPKKVTVSPQVIAAARITTARAKKEALSVVLSLPGEITADPDRSARISSPVPGRIEEVTFREGKVVKKGDALVVIRVPELGKVRAAFASASARAAAARANADRVKALVDQRLAAEQTWLDAKAQADSLDAEARSLGEQLDAMGAGASGGSDYRLVLRAPLSGVVMSRDAVVGQPVTGEQILGAIADLSEVWFLGRVFEKDLGRLNTGAPADVGLNAYPKEHFSGTVESVGRQIDPVARTLTARVRLKNKDERLRVGLFGIANVATEEVEQHEAAIVVPRSAVTEIAGKTVVFVRQPDASYEWHEVALGDAARGLVEVVSGLREGEDVVVDGAFTLKSLVLRSALAEED